MNSWSKQYWFDLGERVASSLIGGLLTLLVSTNLTDISTELGWTIVGIPTLTSLLKGLLANLKDSESGPSLLPSPPAPEVD